MLSKRIIRPNLIGGALTAAIGVYLGTQIEDDTHSDNLLKAVEDKILEDYGEIEKGGRRRQHDNS